MAYTRKQGLHLRDADVPRNREPGWLLGALFAWACTVLLLLGGLSLARFAWGYIQAVAAVTAAMFCAAFALLSRAGRRQWFFVALPGVLLLLTVVCGRWVLEGFCLVWNRLGDAWLLGTGRVLTRFQTRFSGGQSVLSVSLFVTVVTGLVATFSCAVAALAPGALGSLLAAGLLWTMAAFRLSGFSLMLPVLAAAVLLLCAQGWERNPTPVPMLLSWGLCAVTAVALLLLTLLPGLREGAKDLSDSVHSALHTLRYETKHTTLPEGDLAELTPEGDSGKALTVTMEIPESMYLRGFTGVTFTDGSWEPMEKENLLKNRELLYWLNLSSFDPDCQFAEAANQAGLHTNTVIIQNTGACSRYRYVPFSLCPGEFLDPEDLNTQGVLSDRERVYSYSAISGGADAVSRVISHLQLSEDPDVLDYRRAESSYRSFVYSHYTHIPQEAMDLLEDQWERTAREYGAGQVLTEQMRRECALRFLARCFPEEGTPEDMELPLSGLAGSSYQYATVAVLTLRYFGIPARYAEGYVITSQMAANVGPGEAIGLDGTCASAWAEVYQDGVGWVPMDLTPGLSEMIEHIPDDTLSSEKGEQENDEEPEESEEDQPKEEPTETPDPSGGSMVTIFRKYGLWFLLPLLLAAVLIFLVWLRRKKALERKQKRFAQEDVAAAVAWIFADTARLMEILGMDRGNGSMHELVKNAEACFGEEYAAMFAAAIACNEQALFSGRPLEESGRQTALSFRDRTVGLLNTQLKWYRKFWLKWGRCLY